MIGVVVIVEMCVVFGMFGSTNRRMSFMYLFRRNATALCQPRPAAWVLGIRMKVNPNGVALMSRVDRSWCSTDRWDFVHLR